MELLTLSFIELSQWIEQHAVSVVGLLVSVLLTLGGAIVGVGVWMVKNQYASNKQLGSLTTTVGNMSGNVEQLEARMEKHIDDKGVHVTSDRFDALKGRFDAFENRLDKFEDRQNVRFDKLEEMIRSRDR